MTTLFYAYLAKSSLEKVNFVLYVLWGMVSSNIILESVRSCYVRQKFYIQLTLPISPEIMDGLWCSRCVNDRMEVPDMMRLFASGATTPWWWKFELNNPGCKLKICATLITILHYLEAKLDYSYFMIIVALCFKYSTQKISSHFD